jgi:hypothetical protein
MRWGKTAFWTAMFLMCFASVTLAANRKPKPEEPKVNPLEITTPDPLLPKLPSKDNPLSPEQQLKLKGELDAFNARQQLYFRQVSKKRLLKSGIENCVCGGR